MTAALDTQALAPELQAIHTAARAQGLTYAGGVPPVDTLTVYCEHDNYVAPAVHLQLPGAQRIVLEGIGHLSLLYSSQVASLLIAELAPASVACADAGNATHGNDEQLCWKR